MDTTEAIPIGLFGFGAKGNINHAPLAGAAIPP